jgi:trehalose 6-phosphate phosphatase
LGDDLTDEDAFQVLEGRGLSILVRAAYRETIARAWLRPPQELIAFLEQWRSDVGG